MTAAVVPSAEGLPPGSRIRHAELGEGVVLEPARDGWLRAFFPAGERRVPVSAVQPQRSRAERMLSAVEGNPERLLNTWLCVEAHSLPLMDGATTLTSAKIDLLPHQVVLTHRIATASPRRYLVADEVGLGKTIETALVLRELASRGELARALMVVPAGLVNNWHRELNEVFNLGFEVFGSEGDITDRKTNAFARHDRLIASIDTLKRPTRIKRLLEAPRWDLVVFDEAHHLTAWQSGGKVRKTENYKLAESLRDHTRDLLLLSATPHQGNHFQFWMLVQLLSPGLFSSPQEMMAQRHRLNSVMFRRTKADACKPDGSPLFARRWVHTESFLMNEGERRFYDRLREYLDDGFDLARRQGNTGRALGFLMAIFQKIAASSFSAVRRTLERRLLMLTLHEALLRDRDLDVEGRERLLAEARELVHRTQGLAHDRAGMNECERVLADLKYRLVKRLDEEALELASDPYGSEFATAHAEEAAASVVNLHLPEERLRIGDLLATFPAARETKAQKLIDGLGTLWKRDPAEKVVIFATYLGTVDLIEREINAAFPDQGVVVLRGGDHGAKVAAERRFKQAHGPRVMVCTAAGREGINLQFARVLFNFDLPWNPMDVEQRIGRIHRYGQQHTAQVYNLVLSDTIEGRIFLLLDDKLNEIAKAVGKVDERGEVAEDLRMQILGQLSERLNYDKLYQEALSDPELKRTQGELEAALSNSREAREVVFDLFQDLDGFSLDDYTPLADTGSALDRLALFLERALQQRGWAVRRLDAQTLECKAPDSEPIRFTSDRDQASGQDGLQLLGLDHVIVQAEIGRVTGRRPEDLGASVAATGSGEALLTFWRVESSSADGLRRASVQAICSRTDGVRLPSTERQTESVFGAKAEQPRMSMAARMRLLQEVIEPALQRELALRSTRGSEGFSAELLGCVELVHTTGD
jgi:SNF2 family DNA or RNA helicase